VFVWEADGSIRNAVLAETEVFLKWVEGETPPSLKENEKYGFLAAAALYF
jgi:hypothetical protein